MRRIALLASTMAATGFLSGCSGSGYGTYLGDTFRVPFHSDPNIATGNSETYYKIRGKAAEQPPPILYEAGDVWPEPPKPPPTLKDLQAQQNRDINNAGNAAGNYTPLQPLPQLPGYEVPEQQPRYAAPTTSFPGGVVPLPNGGHGNITGSAGTIKSFNTPTSSGSIVVPNGNGTSTVIGPNGAVSTIPSPGK
jgi:hypothetical protein